MTKTKFKFETTLALDLATQTGWAFESMGVIASGSTGFQITKGEKPGDRFNKFRTWLREMLDEIKPDKVAYEEVMRWSSGAAAKCYCGLLAILQSECRSRKIPCVGVGVGTIKKHATKKGNATKDEMIQAMKVLGHKPCDDNEADALALLYFMINGCITPCTNNTKPKPTK
jgi:Holliday junction resolvasome RuvABC endonuclease subunit